MRPLRLILTCSIALTVAISLAACGSDNSNDEDPQQVLDATFDNQESVDSGVLDISFSVHAEGGDDAGSLDASLGGPFQSGDGGAPQFDLSVEADVDSSLQQFSADAGLVSTGEQAFVSFQDTDYEVPSQLFDQFEQGFLQAEGQQGDQGNLLSSLGIDPSNWLTDLSNDGTEDVEGTETIHISGQADVPDLVADVKQIVENVPQAAARIDAGQLSQLDQLTGIVESADFDIYSGEDDDVLRKLEANLELNPPDAAGGAESISVNFTVTLSDLNESQTISAPANAQPLSTLLDQFGLDSGQLGEL